MTKENKTVEAWPGKNSACLEHQGCTGPAVREDHYIIVKHSKCLGKHQDPGGKPRIRWMKCVRLQRKNRLCESGHSQLQVTEIPTQHGSRRWEPTDSRLGDVSRCGRLQSKAVWTSEPHQGPYFLPVSSHRRRPPISSTFLTLSP